MFGPKQSGSVGAAAIVAMTVLSLAGFYVMNQSKQQKNTIEAIKMEAAQVEARLDNISNLALMRAAMDSKKVGTPLEIPYQPVIYASRYFNETWNLEKNGAIQSDTVPSGRVVTVHSSQTALTLDRDATKVFGGTATRTTREDMGLAKKLTIIKTNKDVPSKPNYVSSIDVETIFTPRIASSGAGAATSLSQNLKIKTVGRLNLLPPVPGDFKIEIKHPVRGWTDDPADFGEAAAGKSLPIADYQIRLLGSGVTPKADLTFDGGIGVHNAIGINSGNGNVDSKAESVMSQYAIIGTVTQHLGRERIDSGPDIVTNERLPDVVGPSAPAPVSLPGPSAPAPGPSAPTGVPNIGFPGCQINYVGGPAPAPAPAPTPAPSAPAPGPAAPAPAPMPAQVIPGDKVTGTKDTITYEYEKVNAVMTVTSVDEVKSDEKNYSFWTTIKVISRQNLVTHYLPGNVITPAAPAPGPASPGPSAPSPMPNPSAAGGNCASLCSGGMDSNTAPSIGINNKWLWDHYANNGDADFVESSLTNNGLMSLPGMPSGSVVCSNFKRTYQKIWAAIGEPPENMGSFSNWGAYNATWGNINSAARQAEDLYVYIAPACIRTPVAPRGTCGCFEEKTLIRMADGTEKPAFGILQGDMLWNPKTHKAQKVRLVTVGPENLPLYAIKAAGKLVKVTQGHPFLTDKGLFKAKDLKVGDSLIDDGKVSLIESIEQIVPDLTQKAPRVWNFELEGSNDPDDHYVLANGIMTGDLFLQKLLSNEITEQHPDDAAPQSLRP